MNMNRLEHLDIAAFDVDLSALPNVYYLRNTLVALKLSMDIEEWSQYIPHRNALLQVRVDLTTRG